MAGKRAGAPVGCGLWHPSVAKGQGGGGGVGGRDKSTGAREEDR